jgi:hypothetical protein
LHAADIAPSESLAYRQTNEFLPREDVWDDLGLQLRGAKVEDWRQTNHVASKQTVHIAPGATARKLRVDDELDPRIRLL